METPRQREKWTVKRTLEISCGDSKAKGEVDRKEDLRDQLWRLQGKGRNGQERGP